MGNYLISNKASSVDIVKCYKWEVEKQLENIKVVDLIVKQVHGKYSDTIQHKGTFVNYIQECRIYHDRYPIAEFSDQKLKLQINGYVRSVTKYNLLARTALAKVLKINNLNMVPVNRSLNKF